MEESENIGIEASITQEPELLEGPEIGSALVPALPAQTGRIGRWLHRVIERVPARPVEVPVELLDRIDGLEVQHAALEEFVAKRLDENEGRTLHLLEQRIGVLQEEIRGSLQDSVERQLDLRQQDLTGRLVRVGVLAAVGGAALTLALLFALGVISL